MVVGGASDACDVVSHENAENHPVRMGAEHFRFQDVSVFCRFDGDHSVIVDGDASKAVLPAEMVRKPLLRHGGKVVFVGHNAEPEGIRKHTDGQILRCIHEKRVIVVAVCIAGKIPENEAGLHSMCLDSFLGNIRIVKNRSGQDVG